MKPARALVVIVRLHAGTISIVDQQSTFSMDVDTVSVITSKVFVLA